jgi:uncharacterized repeat protein (TIGR02543 family)
MRKIKLFKALMLIVSIMLISPQMWGANGDVLFTQNFSSGSLTYTQNVAYTKTTTLTNLVGNGANLFTSLTTSNKNSTGIAINNSTGGNKTDATGIFQAYFNNTSGYWSCIRTNDFAATAPTALKMTMDVWVNIISGTSNAAGVYFAIGDGFTDALKSSSAEGTSVVHSGFGITAENSPTICQYNTPGTDIYATTLSKSTWLSITWIMNNTGDSLTYNNPTGSGTSKVANDKFDIWLKTQAGALNTYTKVVSNQAATTGSVALQELYIGSTGGKKMEFRMDNIVVTDLTPGASCTTNATVEAGSNSSVTATTATVSCSSGISALGSAGCSISSYGFVLGTSANPTISNTKYQVGTTYTTTGTSFSKNLTGLTAGTTYYVRPYATNGNGTAYGTQTLFTTLPTAPTFSPTSGSTVGGSQTITITGHSGSTVYYAWATSAQTADAIYNGGSGSCGTASAGTASTTVVSGKTLYAISRLTNNSAVSSASYTVDVTAPTLSSSTPADGATNVAVSGNIVMTFSENVPTVDGSKFSFSGGGAGTLNTGSISLSGATVTIPYYGLDTETDYTVNIAAGAVKDAVGNANAATSFDFTTVAPACSAPSAPTISGETSYDYNDAISIKATCSSGASGTTTYTWYKGSTWEAAYSAGAIQGAAVAGDYGDYIIKYAVVADAGTYWCEASNGSGCEAHNTTGFTISVAKADMPSTGLATGTATSITSTGATLPFTMTSTSGVGSLTIKVYDDNDDVVKTVTNITPATSGSQAVTGLSAGTTYYYTITPIGDANHNDGSETSASSTFTTETVAYSVTYAANGGSGSVPTDANSYSPNAEVTVLGKNTLSKSGYSFCGWSYNGYVYVEGDKFEITEDATLTAVWNQNDVTVTITNFETTKHSKSNNKPDSQAYYLFGYKGSVSEANAVTLTTTSSNNYGQNSGVEIRVDNSSTLRIYADNATSTTPSSFSNVTNVAFEAKLYNSGNTERTTGYTIKVGGTTVGSGNVVGVAADGYKSISTGTFSATNGYVDIILGSGNSNNNLYVDNIAITYSASTYKKVSFNKGSGPSTVSGLPADRYVPSGSKISRPATDPTAIGYIFNGWVTTSGGSTPFNFASTTISSNTTIYASWTAKTQPTQYTVSGDTYYCPGETAEVTLSGSQSGASYQLKKNGSAQGDPKAGTGSALSWTGLTAGTYTISAVETATYAARDMSGSVTVAAAATTAINTQPTTSVSATASVNFTLGSDMVTAGQGLGYQWYSYTSSGGAGEAAVAGAQSATYTTSKSAGTYYYKVKVSGDCGDPVYSSMITVTVKIAPTVYSLSGEPTALCGGTATLTLSGSDDGVSYQLYKGGDAEGDPKAGDGEEIEWTGIDAAGTYTVKTVETSTYAEATMSGSVTISIMTPTSITTQPTTSATGHDGVNFTIGSNLVGAGEGTLTYQWYSYTSSGGAGESAVGSATTTKTLTTSKTAGTYYYKVEVIGSCGSVKSNMITVTVDNNHLLSFSANSGNGSVPGSAYYAPSASVTINSTTMPTRDGYVFLGWNTNNTGTGDMYQPGATYTMPATATTLYAAWGSPCFSFSKGTKGTEPTDGFVMTPENINSSAFTTGATLSGGTLTNTSGATLGINGSYGFVMVKNTRSISVSLGSGAFQAGTVIYLEGYTNKNSTAYTYGFSVSGNAAGSPVNESTNAYVAFKQRYVVTAGDGIAGTSSFTLTFNASATGSQAYLSSIAIGNCLSCTTISPTLTYSATTLYAFGGTPNTATPTLNKDGNTGAVTWTSSNTDAVTVDASGNITAVGAGSATITAELPYDGTHCGGTASCDITVPALVTQTLNVASETAWGTTPALTFTPSDKGMEQVLRLTKNTFTFDSTSTSTKQDGTSKRWMTASFTGSETTKGKYLKMAFKNTQHNLRLGEVVVPIQPISNNGSAQVEIYEGSTLRMTSTAVTGITKGSLADVHFTFASPYVFAAGSTINVYIYFYGQTTGFRLASPILVNGGVLTQYEYTGDGADENWSTAANWNWGKLPLADDNVTLLAPATVNTTTAVAKSVVINTDAPNTGKLTIANNGVLTVDETITAIKSGVAAATAVNDVIIDCSETSQGALIFEQPSSGLQTKGTVNIYTKSSRVGGKLQWQYVGYPFISGYDYDYDGYYINKYSETQGGWIVMRDQGDRTINAWDGLAISGDGAGGAQLQGTFVPTTGDKEFTLTYTAGKGKGKNLIGNSWTAPIQITSLSASDFGGARATIYIFNTGRYGEKETSPSGSWVTLPVEAVKAAPGDYDITVIPAFQGFQVKTADTEDKTLTLNYDSHVRPATNTMNKPLSAPARRAHSEISHISLTVESDVARQRVHLFEGADFSEAYDNGWDGDYVGVSGQNAYLYVVSPTLGKLAVDAESSLEGRIVALQSAAEKEYTFTFTGDETGYFLNDLKTENSTLISEGNSYTFTYEQGDDYNRFMISAMPFSKTQPTGLDDADWNGTGVQKVIYKDHMYIIRGGRVFDATGAMVK